MTIIKHTPVAELDTTILAGLNSYRASPGVSLSLGADTELKLLTQAVSQVQDGLQALRELVVLAETFGWPEQLAYETREKFVMRRTAELDEVVARVGRERAKLSASGGGD